MQIACNVNAVLGYSAFHIILLKNIYRINCRFRTKLRTKPRNLLKLHFCFDNMVLDL